MSLKIDAEKTALRMAMQTREQHIRRGQSDLKHLHSPSPFGQHGCILCGLPWARATKNDCYASPFINAFCGRATSIGGFTNLNIRVSLTLFPSSRKNAEAIVNAANKEFGLNRARSSIQTTLALVLTKQLAVRTSFCCSLPLASTPQKWTPNFLEKRSLHPFPQNCFVNQNSSPIPVFHRLPL